MGKIAKGVLSPVPCFLLLLAAASVCAAGPVVTIEGNDGHRATVELIGYADGALTVRSIEAPLTRDVAETDIRSINFGDFPIELRAGRRLRAIVIPQGSDPLPYFMWAIENRYYLLLATTCRADVARYGKGRVKRLEAGLEADVAKSARGSGRNRDLRLAQVVVASALQDRARAERYMSKLRSDYPEDKYVRRFDEARRRLNGLGEDATERGVPRRRRPESRDAAPSKK